MPGKENLPMKDGSQAIFQVHEAAEPRAIMLVLHGFAEFIGLYNKAAQYFNAQGISLCVHDQRGFGEAVFNKKRMRGVADSYDLFLDDIDVVYDTMQQRYPGLPIILFGHSMGGNIALSYLFSRPQDMFKMMILETPWLRLHTPLGKRLLALSRQLGNVSPKLAVRTSVGNSFRKKSRRRNDNYHYNRLSFRLIAAISEAGEQAIPRAAEIEIPSLLLSSEKDTTVSTEAIQEFYAGANDNMRYSHIKGGHHALHMDRPQVREHAFELMQDFIDTNL